MTVFESILGTTPGVSIGITVVFMGGCAAMAGQALARTWRPIWHAVPYGLMLTGADRFLIYALFNGRLLSWSGYLVDAVLLMAACAMTYRATRASQMAAQYPWLYKRTGLFSWSERIGHSE